ncbi:hypothetical protein C7N83_13900 [Neisseria iguanae]|uniref:Uncharacterized protein n=2 Tax=Neisseria iguanae TaxID=90242 RepID=A0A2P7TWT1_9NEIS|nr:hypothetical protein C7N83_13900 [Neisseria iguanae]
MIQTADYKQRQAVETDENSVFSENTPGKDKDARRVKKDGTFKSGYKQHTHTDSKGYLEKRHINPAGRHGGNHFELRLSDIA